MDIGAISNANLYSVQQALSMSMLGNSMNVQGAAALQLLDGLNEATEGLAQSIASVVGQNVDMSV